MAKLWGKWGVSELDALMERNHQEYQLGPAGDHPYFYNGKYRLKLRARKKRLERENSSQGYLRKVARGT